MKVLDFTFQDSEKARGFGAKMSPDVSVEYQANIDSSSDDLIISCCSLLKAFAPSPYRRGMFTLNNPIRQYASSSTRVVSLHDVHDIFSAMHAFSDEKSPGIPVISAMRPSRLLLVPINPQD
jgi:hypothetical protein